MQQLDPKAVWLFFYIGFLKSLFIIAFLFLYGFISVAGVSSELSFGTAMLLLALSVLVILLIIWIWAKLTYHFYRYELREDGFRKESGIIWKKYVSIPYDRIQNVDIYRGLLARILGLSDLRIQTAGASRGGHGAEGKLPGVSRETAEQLRGEIMRHTNSRSQGI